MSKPKYMFIYEDLKNAIEQGKYKPGSKVPSEKELAKEWDVSVVT